METINIKEILQCKFKTDDFLQNNKNLVRKVLNKTYPSIINTYDEEDFIQEGMLGLYNAMIRFDESKDCKFSTLAYICIRSMIIKRMKVTRNKIKMYDKNVISIYSPVSKNMSDGDRIIDRLKDNHNYTNITDTTYNQKVITRLREKLKKGNREIFEYILQKKTPLEMAQIKGCSKSNIYEIIKGIKEEADYIHEKVYKTAG